MQVEMASLDSGEEKDTSSLAMICATYMNKSAGALT